MSGSVTVAFNSPQAVANRNSVFARSGLVLTHAQNAAKRGDFDRALEFLNVFVNGDASKSVFSEAQLEWADSQRTNTLIERARGIAQQVREKALDPRPALELIELFNLRTSVNYVDTRLSNQRGPRSDADTRGIMAMMVFVDSMDGGRYSMGPE